MKPIFEVVTRSANSSFTIREFTEKRFSAPYHYHPEYELTLIVKGSGKRYVGTHMQDYQANDLMLLGVNLPHCWKTSEQATEPSVSIVVHFGDNFLGDNIFHIPEMAKIAQLLKESSNGLYFKNKTETVKRMMQVILGESDKYRRLILLLDLLHYLATATKYTALQKKSELASLSLSDKERIHEVFAYIVDNFQHDISLDGAAAIANLSSYAFCKYFKRMTRKTFVEAVTDYRIDFAVRELINTDKSIAHICYESGFNDASNFYKTFRRRFNISPLQYRNSFKKKLD
ncbi:MAG: AraC family transcriptional regulator [Niabella sp.]